MARIGDAARHLRETLGLSQKDAAKSLGITNVYLCNVEANKATPSPAIIERYRQLWNVDLHVLAWCLFGELNALPPGIRDAASRLATAWRAELGVMARGADEEERDLPLATEEDRRTA